MLERQVFVTAPGSVPKGGFYGLLQFRRQLGMFSAHNVLYIRLKGAEQRKLVALSQLSDLFRLGFSYLKRIHSGHANALLMNRQHYGYGFKLGLAKDFPQHPYDKIPGRIVVVVEYYAVEGRRLQLCGTPDLGGSTRF
jgi:hypothetical protein